MPSDDYASMGGGGALKIKGAKINKKKKKKDKTDLEKNLSAETAVVKAKDKSEADDREKSADAEKEEEEEVPTHQKTESERRYDEVKRKRLLQTAEVSGGRPELLKTHKERVEQLNTYLSKLSEHHDMPKIGPG